MQANTVKCTTDKKCIHKRCSDVHGDLLLVNRAPLIKALTATGWGKQKETLMATYKAVMRPALEYASSIWSSLASSTSINKLQVMQNTALRTAPGCTQDTNIQHLHDETLILPIHDNPQLRASQYKQKTYITPLTQTYNILQHSKALKTQSLTTAATQQTFPQTPHSHYNRHKNIHILSLGIYPQEAIQNTAHTSTTHHQLYTSPSHSSHPCTTQNK